MYGAIGGKTRKISKLYGTISAKTRNIKKVYGVIGGVTKLIYTSAIPVEYPINFITNYIKTDLYVESEVEDFFLNGATYTTGSGTAGFRVDSTNYSSANYTSNALLAGSASTHDSIQTFIILPKINNSYDYLVGKYIYFDMSVTTSSSSTRATGLAKIEGITSTSELTTQQSYGLEMDWYVESVTGSTVRIGCAGYTYIHRACPYKLEVRETATL